MVMQSKYLRVGLLNAGSLGTNHDDFIAGMIKHNVEIMAVNETWLQAGEEGRAPHVPGYCLRHVPRPPTVRAGRGGGVGFYIKRGVKFRTFSHPVDPKHQSVEQMWLTLKVNGKKVAIGTAYRPPWLDVELFLDALTDTVNSVSCCDNIIVLGDFNINMLSTNDNKTKNLLTVLRCLNLSQIVTSPTHFTNTSQSLIDVVCTDLVARHVVVEPVGSLFGHSFVICEFSVKRDKYTPHAVTYRPLKNIDLVSFSRDIELFHWDHISSCSDVNDMVHMFNEIVLTLFDLHAPIKTCTIKERHYPWITDNVKLMMNLRNEALSDYRHIKLDVKKVYYKSLKSLVNQSLFFEKSAYYKHNINNKVNDPKLLWKNLKSTLLPSNGDIELPSHFKDANAINNHFLAVPGKADVTISQLTSLEFIKKACDSVFSIKTTNSHEIFNIIKGLKSNAEGFDHISLNMLLMTLPKSLEALTALVNASISTSTFPDLWKIAIVRPLPKNNNPIRINDLRPISILPCLSKIIEKVVCKQLTEYIEVNNILPDVQSGFRKGRSTSTALLDVTDNILASQDKGMCTLLVLLDFSRAFDAINTTLLLSKLNYYGFEPEAIKWFDSYLSGRYQYVELRQATGSTISSTLTGVNRGVPQGSILGPILFILYSADVIKCLKNCKYHIYADDIQVYISFKPKDLDIAISELNEDLSRIANWSVNNCLLLNASKTKCMFLGSKHQLAAIPPIDNIKLMGQYIERVYEAKNLGLNVDAELRFEKHVADCVRNCFYRLKTLYKLRPYLSEELRVQLVESLILSKLNYADTVYGPRLLSRTQRLIQRVQNACARYCYTIPPRSHVTPFLNKHYSLRMKSRRKLHLACLLFGVINYKQPSYLYNKINWFSDSRNCLRRHGSLQLTIPRHRTTTFKGCFRYAATRCWNNLPPPLQNLKSLHNFKEKLKKYLISEQIQHADINVDFSFL